MSKPKARRKPKGGHKTATGSGGDSATATTYGAKVGEKSGYTVIGRLVNPERYPCADCGSPLPAGPFCIILVDGSADRKRLCLECCRRRDPELALLADAAKAFLATMELLSITGMVGMCRTPDPANPGRMALRIDASPHHSTIGTRPLEMLLDLIRQAQNGGKAPTC